MSLRQLVGALAAMALVVMTPSAEASTFRTQDYAYSATLETIGPGPVYSASLPIEVYRAATHADLRDVCIVNGDSEVVPFAIRRPEPVRLESVTRLPLKLFPIYGATEARGEALRLRLRAGETTLDLERPASGTNSERPSSYLVDARSMKNAIAELRVGWTPSAAPFAAQLSIDESEDLEHWRRVSSGAQIVNLRYSGQEFVRDSVALAPAKTSFLRLTWDNVMTGPVITQITASPPRVDAPLSKLSYSVTGTPTSREGEYEFNLGARLPVEQVNLLLPERNSVVSAEFLVPSTEGRNWRSVVNAQLYHLAVPSSQDLINPPISVPLTEEPSWRVRIAQTGGGIGRGVPRLEVSWAASEVVFLARGVGPYQLLYGNAAANSLALDSDAILRPAGTRGDSEERFQPDHATLATPQILGGIERLKPVNTPPDWKRWILWTVLVAGVAALGTMAWKLSKSIA